MTAAALIERLDGVRRTGDGRWIARCPAHDDRSPSLSIRETSDGTTLIRCHAGCGAADIVDAIGMHLRDLFPRREHYPPEGVRPTRYPPREALALLRREIHIVSTLASDMRSGIVPTDGDMGRLTTAVWRISTVADESAALDATPSDEILRDVAAALGRWA